MVEKCKPNLLMRITHSPYLNLLSGVILLFTSLQEIISTVDAPSFGLNHGVLIFSIVQLIKVIPEFTHGLTECCEADDLMRMQRKTGSAVQEAD